MGHRGDVMFLNDPNQIIEWFLGRVGGWNLKAGGPLFRILTEGYPLLTLFGYARVPLVV